jgi:hypothetical protein
MRIEIEIPKEFVEEFNKDRFEESLNRLLHDSHLLAGKYEREVAEMLIKAFKNAKPACNIDKIVEKLEEYKTKAYYEATSVKNSFPLGANWAFQVAIKIVKRGGINGKT